MKTSLIDERIATLLPEELVHYWEIKESRLYDALQEELGDESREKVDTLLGIMHEIEVNLTDKCLAETKKSSWRDFREAMGRNRFA